MAKHDHTLNPSAQLAPAIEGAGPPTPGRRRMLALAAGTAAMATAASSVTAQATDEPLDRLWAEYQRINALLEEANEAATQADSIARTQHPPRPHCLFGILTDTGELVELHIDEIRRWRDQAAALAGPGVEIHERQVVAWETWQAACAEVNVAHGLPELERRSAELLDEVMSLEERIFATPAQSIAGVLVKLRLLAEVEDYSDEEGGKSSARLVLGLIADIEAAI